MKTNLRKEILVYVLGALIILAFALTMSATAHADGAEPQYFAEPSLAWVTCWRTSVRPEPKADGRIDYIYNGDYLAVQGLITANGDTFAIVPLRSVGINQDGVGYVSCHTIQFGPKKYVTNYYGAWAYCAPSEQVPCVGQLVAEETRVVLGEVQDAQGYTWYSIQIDTDSRGAAFLRKEWVCEPYSTSEDLAREQQVKATYRSPYAPPMVQPQQQTPTTIIIQPEQGTTIYAGYTATAARDTFVYSNPGDNVVGTLRQGEQGYVYQIIGTNAQVVWNNQWAMVALVDLY